jgi:hypothetical protein
MGKFGTYSLSPVSTTTGIKYKLFNFSQFGDLFSNTVFAYLMHHSLPGIVKNSKPETSLKKTNLFAYVCAYVSLTIISYTAVLAFGP